MPTEAAGTLRRTMFRGGDMISQFGLRALVCGALVSLGAMSLARAEGTYEIPAGAHFNQDKLARITEFFKNEVATGKIAGATVLIQQHGKPVYHEAFGVQDVVSKAPITDKTIFRLFSMTKAITAVVAMQLVEDGKIKLDDPVSKYIPSFANVKVGVEKKAEDGTKSLELVPPNRPMTVHDLMTHTSGITYGFYGDSLVRKAYREANIYAGDFDLAEFAERIARLPLHNQPGALWQYGHSTDVLARVMEVAAGKPLIDIMREKLLDPLGMVDTGFFVTDPEKQKLLAQPLPNDSDFRVGRINDPTVAKKIMFASGGMVTTMADYRRFAQMLLNGGSLDGKTILKPETFKLMATDQVGPGSGVDRDFFYFPGDGFGFGLGLAVRTDPGNAKPPPPGNLGELKWDGASGCYFVIDPKQDMFFVLLEQTPSERQRVQRTLKQLVYEAMKK
ncbi:class A beta-lactamase-related serine hydrolase [Bradyrhizobium sp. LVM 105]|nr:class A beta-lactamase-related serine hydrolase [Bradyrhizobium sp. LVM 105]